MAVKPIPEGYNSVTPYLIVQDAGKLIDFLKQSFGAQEKMPPMKGPNGNIIHAELRIGDSVVMLAEPMGEFKPLTSMFYLYVNDVDAVYKQTLQAGASVVREPADQFYGDRSATVRDPWGNIWGIATHTEDVPPQELAKRAEAVMKQAGS
ncbi:MAG: VOC family protein [Acidobacteria bacterium]|nr:VOC family protein [Acidobacteriota bacterium]